MLNILVLYILLFLIKVIVYFIRNIVIIILILLYVIVSVSVIIITGVFRILLLGYGYLRLFLGIVSRVSLALVSSLILGNSRIIPDFSISPYTQNKTSPSQSPTQPPS